MNELRQPASLLNIDLDPADTGKLKPLCYRVVINLMEGYRESGLVHRPKVDVQMYSLSDR